MNRSKQKGTQYESLIRDYLKEHWNPDIERMPLSGGKDRGDIAGFRVGEGRHLIAWELKNRTQMSLSEWIREAQEEAENYGAVAGIVVHKRKGKGLAGDQYVTLTLDDFLNVVTAAGS